MESVFFNINNPQIRAKEAAKVKDSLTRDPAEDNKTRMMGHLPEIIRILRSYPWNFDQFYHNNDEITDF